MGRKPLLIQTWLLNNASTHYLLQPAHNIWGVQLAFGNN